MPEDKNEDAAPVVDAPVGDAPAPDSPPAPEPVVEPVETPPAPEPVVEEPVVEEAHTLLAEEPLPEPVEENVQTFAARVSLPRGKAPHVHDDRDFLFKHYASVDIPAGVLGHDTLVGTNDWGMLGNGPDDSVAPGFEGAGNCVFAGGDHETLLDNAEAQTPVSFTGANAISDYSEVTGYVLNDESTDRGTDVRNALKYRAKTGLIDASGKRHKIAAYVALTAGDLDELKASVYLFSKAGIGINFPESAMDQFNAGQPWSVVEDSPLDGGHYIPVFGFDPSTGYFYVVTWGRLQAVTPGFIQKYMDEGYAILSNEFLSNGKSLEGFDIETLTADLTDLSSDSPTPPPTPESADQTFADVLAPWSTLRHINGNKTTATAARKWLTAKGL